MFMKRIYTTLALLGVFATSAFAQKTIDLSISPLFPVNGTTYANLAEGDTFYMAAIVTNNGPGTLGAGDTIVITRELGMTGNPGITTTGGYLATNLPNTFAGGSDTLVWAFVEGSVLGTLDDETDVICNFPVNATADTSFMYIYGFNADGLFTDAGIDGSGNISSTGNNIFFWNDVSFGAPSSLEAISGLKKEQLVTYPNPAVNEIGFKYDFQKNSNAVIRVTDIAGRIVLTNELGNQVVGEKAFSLDISALNNGMYQLELITDGKRAISKFSVKK